MYFLASGMVLFLILLNQICFVFRCDFVDGKVIDMDHDFPVIQFVTDDCKSVSFTGYKDLYCRVGDNVRVIYVKTNVTHAKVYSFVDFWIRGLFRGLFPIIILNGIIYAFFNKNEVLVIKRNRFFTIKKTRVLPIEKM
jgi:hypothetical protein